MGFRIGAGALVREVVATPSGVYLIASFRGTDCKRGVVVEDSVCDRFRKAATPSIDGRGRPGTCPFTSDP